MRNRASFWIKADHARQLTGGVIVDVVSPEQAIVAADAGAAAVAVGCFGLQRGGDAITDGATVASVLDTVSIPVIARARDRAQAKELEALEVDYLLERCTDDGVVDKWSFPIPFVCEATSLGDVAGKARRRRSNDLLHGADPRHHRRASAPHVAARKAFGPACLRRYRDASRSSGSDTSGRGCGVPGAGDLR